MNRITRLGLCCFPVAALRSAYVRGSFFLLATG